MRCSHPFRGATGNPAWVICEVCGDCLRASVYPVNMSEGVHDEMMAAKGRWADEMLADLRKLDFVEGDDDADGNPAK